jgi:uncharacterized membrane protein
MFERYVFAFVLLLVLDFAFLFMNQTMFQNQVITVQRVIMQPNYVGFIMSYVCILALLGYFIIRPHRSVQEAFLLGLLTYGVFEFTNKAIFKKWEYMTVIIDTLWGGILFGLTTWGTYTYYSR